MIIGLMRVVDGVKGEQKYHEMPVFFLSGFVDAPSKAVRQKANNRSDYRGLITFGNPLSAES